MTKANIVETLNNLHEHWSQRIVAEANDQLFKVAKGLGATNWHKHDEEDEVFLVQKGALRIEFRDGEVRLAPHDIFVVRKGVEHRTIAEQEAEFLVTGKTITSTKEGGKPNR